MVAAAKSLTVLPRAGGAPAPRREVSVAEREPAHEPAQRDSRQREVAGRGPARGDSASGAPSWRALLEARWRARLERVTELSLAFHDAAAGEPARPVPRQAGRPLRCLMRQAIAARRELADTDEALGRLSAGQYGRCESCSGPISRRTLQAAPEARYCSRCAAPPA
jgi:RNA polymerase-binding transcription factor DksA